jgi:hypothetical protein
MPASEFSNQNRAWDLKYSNAQVPADQMRQQESFQTRKQAVFLDFDQSCLIILP